MLAATRAPFPLRASDSFRLLAHPSSSQHAPRPLLSAEPRSSGQAPDRNRCRAFRLRSSQPSDLHLASPRKGRRPSAGAGLSACGWLRAAGGHLIPAACRKARSLLPSDRALAPLHYTPKHHVCETLKRLQALGDSTTALDSLFQCLIILWARKSFLISNLSFPWCSFRPFPLVPSLVTWRAGWPPPMKS